MARRKRRSLIQFPVLKRLEVRNYALFPGAEEDSGFEHRVAKGVSVIVGINGIGKTTLLNLIFRMLVGPFNPSKSDAAKPGSGTHKLTRKSAFRYFSERVPDAARDAWAEADFQFGDTLLTVRRRLRDLQILSLVQDGEEWEDPDEAFFQEVCNELSGTKSDYDFHFLIRHLVFFLEERAPLIWSEDGQFEILRLLFFDDDARVTVAKLTDEVKQLDSQYRNRLYHYNSQRERFEEQLRETETQDEIVQDLESLKALASGSEKRAESLMEQEEVLAKEVDKLEAETFRLQMDLEEQRQSIRHSEAQYFSQLFPSLNDTTRLVLNTLLTDDGCLVCGSDGGDAASRIRAALKKRHCPVCDSPPEQQEQKNTTPLSGAVLRRSSKKFEQLRKRLEDRTKTLVERQSEYDGISAELRENSRERLTHNRQIQRLTEMLPADHDELVEREESLQEQLADLRKLDRRRKAKLKALKKSIVDQDSKINDVVDSIVSTFNRYAKSFLAEDCYLEHGYIDQTIGQGGEKISLPAFKVFLSSGADPTATEREDPDDVSESQKEFIDLAFRMALMQAAAVGNEGRMLVIETPEASLDSIFIDQAGALLREFSKTPRGGSGNVVLTSCNINGAEMIQSLLGTAGNDSARRGTKVQRATYRRKIDKRVIDLVKLAAPSAAYRKFHSAYDELREKIYG